MTSKRSLTNFEGRRNWSSDFKNMTAEEVVAALGQLDFDEMLVAMKKINPVELEFLESLVKPSSTASGGLRRIKAVQDPATYDPFGAKATQYGLAISNEAKLEGTVFINGSKHEFIDISSEEWREYVFDEGVTVRIEKPLMLNVSGNGHRLFDADGVSHYVPSQWVHNRWKVKPGQPHFVA